MKVAAETGYDLVGLRLLPAAASGEADYPIMTDDRLLAEAAAAVRDSGIGVADVEIVRLKAETDVAGFAGFFARGADGSGRGTCWWPATTRRRRG